MNEHTTSSLPSPPCHRCGSPSGGSFINQLPTCAWCIGSLAQSNPLMYLIAPTDAVIRSEIVRLASENIELKGQLKRAENVCAHAKRWRDGAGVNSSFDSALILQVNVALDIWEDGHVG
jgi:hypothetical protein